ncbi:DUF3373 domain-containing protein [Geobacter sp. SVR]|uniref:DUF3373 domain-containing protein n=1 Tax=Geobacter sp. SVR TaxID=2495594 RepID=UPI00143EF808|nr:DUF3373 domain-containing protein [Geobacter sp. SVR]BCS55250.1 hypothetical protein GSVR_35580 [Geobacter sp. SVR]GCF86049.1 hypothetical protein GSbR_26490 [Geobacter sp. SVR]
MKMKKSVLKIVVALAACTAFPLESHALDEDLQKRIDSLTREMEILKGQVKRTEDKSIGKWLTIGGDFRFRVDSLHGQTVAYTSAPAFMNSVQQDSNTKGFFATPQAQGLLGSRSYAAVQGLTPQALMGNMVNYLTAPGGAFAGNPAAAAAYLQQLGAGAAVPAYKPKNETLYTNKLGLDLHAKATQDVSVTVKLAMYKSFGSEDDSQVTGNFFADRIGVFDGTISHIPSSSLLNVDRAYATWSNIADQPVWFSVGRRPSTDGAPENLRLNRERPGNGGTPALLVDYAFDGMTLGYAPDIEALPGAYAKVCYGRGFDSGFKTPTNSIKDTDMLGVAVIPVDTDPLRIWLQWNRGFNIFDFPVMSNTSAFGSTSPSVSLGDIDWYGAGVMSTLKKVGPGTLTFFSDFGMSVTHPNGNVSANAGFQGLGTGAFLAPEAPTSKTGWAVYAGVRYDLPSRTKIGFEFNHGSKNWITFAPAADDIWTAKVGTRGNVYEPYIIQELNLKPISSYFAKAFFKLGYQYYDFEYTGSNNWVGAPQKISSIQGSDMLLLAPLKEAHDVYATFEVHF